MRAGPGTRFPIRWVYLRKGLPVEILRDYDTWRKIRDHRGTEGWVHVGNLTGKRMVLVTKSIRPIHIEPSASAHTVARASPNLVGELLACKGIWCKVSIKSYTGWVRRAHIWGVYADEDFR
jgi:SH3-like domain-containing protein